MSQINLILVLGGPGCGKSTLCRKLANIYNLTHIPVGESLMREIEKNSEIGKIVEQHIKSAVIIPADITFNQFISEVNKYDNKIFLIDGYPRNQENNDYLLNNLPSNMRIIGLLYLQCSEELMIQRINNRKQQIERIDNDDNLIKKRIHVFNQQTIPIIEEYKKKNLVVTIDCSENLDNIISSLKTNHKHLLQFPNEIN